MSSNPNNEHAAKPEAPARTPRPARANTHRTNSVVDDAVQQRIFTEALEHAAKPWNVDSQPPHVRMLVGALVDAVEETMRQATTGAKKVRPLVAVQDIVSRTWLMGFHAGRHFEAGLTKARKSQSTAAGKATRERGKVTTSRKPAATPSDTSDFAATPEA